MSSTQTEPAASAAGSPDGRKTPEGAGQIPASAWEAGVSRLRTAIALLALAAIAVHLVLRFGLGIHGWPSQYPLIFALICGGGPLIYELSCNVIRREFGSDLLAGISIVTSAILGEYLAGAFVVLMLSGGQALEAYAARSASAVLRALAGRMPSVAHRRTRTGMSDIALSEIVIGDILLVHPHEICPVDGEVIEGHGAMDESYLTGEPFQMSKAPGSEVLSGSINGEVALTIRAIRLAVDSRYAKIMQVMRASAKDSPRLRRLGDQLGAWYTPLAVLIALLAWLASGHASRFLAVLVVATPCPLLIAIPVAIIGAISLCARRGIVIKKPSILEQVDTCRTLIFDKTGTLTYGEPRVSELLVGSGFEYDQLLSLTASLEQYSKHPLGLAVLKLAAEKGIRPPLASQISEPPFQGMFGTVEGRHIRITGRKQIGIDCPQILPQLPESSPGLECVVLIDGLYGGTIKFQDEPRADSRPFIDHLGSKHRFDRLMLVSGDREAEVRDLAAHVGIAEIYAGQTPEQKLEIVRRETGHARTLYLGDGINDAPALLAATVGVALGQNSDITTEAAGAVIMDRSLKKVDEFFHISRLMRTIALQSAVGGMALSMVGMLAASLGYLPPVAGAICQEVIDVLAVVNALRAAFPPRSLSDF